MRVAQLAFLLISPGALKKNCTMDASVLDWVDCVVDSMQIEIDTLRQQLASVMQELETHRTQQTDKTTQVSHEQIILRVFCDFSGQAEETGRPYAHAAYTR